MKMPFELTKPRPAKKTQNAPAAHSQACKPPSGALGLPLSISSCSISSSAVEASWRSVEPVSSSFSGFSAYVDMVKGRRGGNEKGKRKTS